MRFWIFLKLAIKDLFSGAGAILAILAVLAGVLTLLAGAAWCVGWAFIHWMPAEIAAAAMDGVKGHDAYLAGGQPFEFPAAVGAGIGYLVLVAAVLTWIAVAIVRGAWRWGSLLWAEAGFEAGQIRKIKRAATVALIGLAAALAAFFGTGCDRADNQESMQTTQQEGGR